MLYLVKGVTFNCATYYYYCDCCVMAWLERRRHLLFLKGGACSPASNSLSQRCFLSRCTLSVTRSSLALLCLGPARPSPNVVNIGSRFRFRVVMTGIRCVRAVSGTVTRTRYVQHHALKRELSNPQTLTGFIITSKPFHPNSAWSV